MHYTSIKQSWFRKNKQTNKKNTSTTVNMAP